MLAKRISTFFSDFGPSLRSRPRANLSGPLSLKRLLVISLPTKPRWLCMQQHHMMTKTCTISFLNFYKECSSLTSCLWLSRQNAYENFLLSQTGETKTHYITFLSALIDFNEKTSLFQKAANDATTNVPAFPEVSCTTFRPYLLEDSSAEQCLLYILDSTSAYDYTIAPRLIDRGFRTLQKRSTGVKLFTSRVEQLFGSPSLTLRLD